MARKGLQHWPNGDWGWRFRLLAAEDLMILSREPEAAPLLATQGAPSQAALRARLTADRGRLINRSDPDRARALFQEALTAARAARDSELECVLHLRLGDLARGFDQVDPFYQEALAVAERRQDVYLKAWARVSLGFNRLNFARSDEAIPLLTQALADARQCGAKSFVAAATGDLGLCYWQLGDFDKAQSAFQSAEKLNGQIGARDSQLRWLGNLGLLYFSKGDLDQAEPFEKRALKLAEDVGNEKWQGIAAHNLAQIAIEKRDLPVARTYSDKALAISRHSRDQQSLVYSELSVAEIEHLSEKSAAAEHDYRNVILQAQQAQTPDLIWEAHHYLASLYVQTGRMPQAAAEYRNAIDTIDRQWSHLSGEQSQTTFLSPPLIGVFQDYVSFLIRTGHTEQALETSESARARVLSRRLRSRGALPPRFDLAGLERSARASHSVILSYWLEPGRSSVWVIGAGPLRRFDLQPGKELGRLVREYMEVVTTGLDPLARNDASSVYQAVLGPVANLIPAGYNVIVVPDGELHQLNFETLVVPGPRPHYWIEDVSISTAPSLRVLTRESHRPVGSPKLLIIGDPVLVGHELAPLPNVKKEIAAVEECFPASNWTSYTGAAAVREKYLQSSPATFTHIHFATHATANLESPLNSAIILSHQGENYKLYARDVADIPLHADLVTLSACHSAGARAYSGEGLMGFAWAFLQAGAQNVIATLWNEDDAVSPDLMRVLYREIAAGQTPAAALRTAKLALLRPTGSHRRPYYWGPLQVFTREIGSVVTSAAAGRPAAAMPR